MGEGDWGAVGGRSRIDGLTIYILFLTLHTSRLKRYSMGSFDRLKHVSWARSVTCRGAASFRASRIWCGVRDKYRRRSLCAVPFACRCRLMTLSLNCVPHCLAVMCPPGQNQPLNLHRVANGRSRSTRFHREKPSSRGLHYLRIAAFLRHHGQLAKDRAHHRDGSIGESSREGGRLGEGGI